MPAPNAILVLNPAFAHLVTLPEDFLFAGAALCATGSAMIFSLRFVLAFLSPLMFVTGALNVSDAALKNVSTGLLMLIQSILLHFLNPEQVSAFLRTRFNTLTA